MKNKSEKEYRKRLKQRIQKTNIYVSCEGKTEKTYFESLNSVFNHVYVQARYNQRTNALNVVNNFNRLFANKDIDNKDIKYCAFDRDENTQNEINLALETAKRQNINVLYSNPCFEIWLYWHFEATRSPRKSKDLKLYMEYKDNFKNYKEDKLLALKLKDNIKQAKTVAKNAQIELNRNNINRYSLDSNPSTNIYELIEEIERRIT